MDTKKIHEAQLREVLLSMSGADVKKLWIEIHKAEIVGEIMDFDLGKIISAIEDLDWMNYVEEVMDELWPEEEKETSLPNTTDLI